MSRLSTVFLGVALAACGAVMLVGCAPQQPIFLGGDGNLDHLLNQQLNIEQPDHDEPPLADASQAREPLSLANPNFDNIWDLSLEEAVHIALTNSKVLRRYGGTFGFQGGGQGGSILGQPGVIPSQLLTSPDALPTVFDPALQSSNPGFGSGTVIVNPASNMGYTGLVNSTQGVEAALAEFDAKLRGSAFWDRTDRPQNRAQNPFFPTVFRQDQLNANLELSKKTASGTQFAFRSVSIYTDNNTPLGVGRAIPSDWFTALEAEARQPLMRGFGTSVNRVPVILARIREDISLADFEAGVRNMVADTERAYWQLYFSYRQLETAQVGRDSALGLWKKIKALQQGEAEGGEADKEAQARGQYFLFRSQVEEALRDLYRSESRLRYMMGIAATDGRLVRPKDEPITAKMTFDWRGILSEALVRSVELRKIKWRIKQREVELIAARNQLLPVLDAVALYRWLGVGDQLMSGNSPQPDFPAIGSTAFGQLFGGQYQEYRAGAELNIPIGFRRELAGVRYTQLLICREKARLEDSELEVSHQLTDAVQGLEANYVLAQTHFNRWVAAQKEVEAFTAIYESGTGRQTLDLLLEAQRRRAEAEIQFHRALTDYTLAISNVHFLKGSLLEMNNLYLAEGPWPGKAYFDAERTARQVDASPKRRYGYTAPDIVSQGTQPQGTEDSAGGGGEFIPAGDAMPAEQMLPAPQPTPARGRP